MLTDGFSCENTMINYLPSVTAVGHTAGYMQEHKLLTDLVNAKSITDSLNKLLEDRFGAKDLVRSEITDHVDFDIKKINAQHLDFDAIKKATTNFLQQQPGIMYAIDMTKIGRSAYTRAFKSNAINGYNSRRSSPLRIILYPGAAGGIGRGTGHGTLHPYDTHISLLFMDWGIHHGSSNATVNITDIAPTISMLLHIQMPNGNIGHVIEGVIK